jgi:ankyrin repeat protein/beta-lactamase regulating signal transducer with metallopeptidase domain
MNGAAAYWMVEIGVHQLWVSALIAGLVCAGLWLRGRISAPLSAESRYWLWYGALAVMAALPLVILVPNGVVPQVQVSPLSQLDLAGRADRESSEASGAVRIVERGPESPITQRSANRLGWVRTAAVPVAWTLVTVWAALTMWRLVVVFRGLATLRRWRREASVVSVPLARGHEVRESVHISTPMVVGVLKPCVLLPAGLRGQLAPEQIEHVLAHELEHIRGRDPQFALVQRLIEAVYFHNPAVRWVSRIVDHERECSCDDRVVARVRDGNAYASSLISVARLVVGAPAPVEAMAAIGHRSQLAQRIERLLSRENSAGERVSWLTVGSITSVVVAAAVLIAPSVPLASEPRPVFGAGSDTHADALSGDGSRALVDAISRGDEDAADELLRAGADINTPVRGDGAPLVLAARSGNKSLVRRLLASGADVNLGSLGDGNPLINAAARGDLYVVKQLVEHGANVNASMPGDGTPLINAARRGRLDVVEYLTSKGADVNQAALGDGNPLIGASARGNLDVVKFLIDHGADVNGYVPGDETPLINASQQGRAEVVKYLVSRGANPNLAVHSDRSSAGELRSPLSEARKHGHDDVVKLLDSLGARQ